MNYVLRNLIFLIIGIIIALLILSQTQITKEQIFNLKISAEVFATVFVGLTVIFFEYGHIFRIAFSKSYPKTVKKMMTFFYPAGISFVSAEIGLLFSVLGGKGLIAFILLLISIVSTAIVTLDILLYYMDLTMEEISHKKKLTTSIDQ